MLKSQDLPPTWGGQSAPVIDSWQRDPPKFLPALTWVGSAAGALGVDWKVRGQGRGRLRKQGANEWDKGVETSGTRECGVVTNGGFKGWVAFCPGNRPFFAKKRRKRPYTPAGNYLYYANSSRNILLCN